ncbi:MAG: hypothetical protein IJO60_00075 [Agathobacter sp.]|nr:hypothetical protein [Agathobacter sp.]
MKNAFRNKLNSSRGASMLLALALFLVCVMVSSIIIGAAASNSSRNLLRTQRQRDYLAVSSAAEMIVNDLEEIGQFVGFYEKKIYGCQDFQNIVTKYYEGKKVQGYEYQEGQIEDSMDAIMVDEHHENVLRMEVDTSEGATTVDGLFGELIIRASKNVFMKNVPYQEKITISAKEEDERIPEIICNFIMDRDYNMSFELTTTGSDYAILIKLKGSKTQTHSIVEPDDTHLPEEERFSCEHLIYFKQKQEDDSYVDASKTEKIYGTSEYINTTITWEPPVVTKGVGLQ